MIFNFDCVTVQTENNQFINAFLKRLAGSSFKNNQFINAILREACRTGVIFCVFQGNRGESEASAKRELRAWGGWLKN